MGVLYWRAPTAADLIGTAYKVSDYLEPDCDVWDENWNVIELFALYSNQWRMTAYGPVGLDINVFHHALDRKGIKGEEFDEYIRDLSVIESAALVAMRDNT